MFQIRSYCIAATLAFGLLLVWLTAARADCRAARDWQTYRVERFGTRLAVPVDCFRVASENEDGWLFETADGRAQLAIYGSRNVDGRGPAGLKRWLIEEVGGYDDVTYSPMGRTWLVLSGYRGSRIFYEKYMLSERGSILHAFSISFPRSAKPVFSPLIERIEDSFRAAQP